MKHKVILNFDNVMNNKVKITISANTKEKLVDLMNKTMDLFPSEKWEHYVIEDIQGTHIDDLATLATY